MPRSRDERGPGDGLGVVAESKAKPKLKKPPLYKVLLHNDDYTTREFADWILIEIFSKGEQEAIQIMLHVHRNGIGVAGIYTFEVAETKVNKVLRLARDHQYPLHCSVEPE